MFSYLLELVCVSEAHVDLLREQDSDEAGRSLKDAAASLPCIVRRVSCLLPNLGVAIEPNIPFWFI